FVLRVLQRHGLRRRDSQQSGIDCGDLHIGPDACSGSVSTLRRNRMKLLTILAASLALALSACHRDNTAAGGATGAKTSPSSPSSAAGGSSSGQTPSGGASGSGS